MLKKIFLVLLAVVALFLIFVALKNPDFRVERSAIIDAPPAVVFAQVNDFHNWEAWSPWAKLDPNAKNSFGGSPSGDGATFAWAGNSDVGEGKMTITESRPDQVVTIRLEFLKPFQDTNTAQFTFQPEAGGTHVTWSMFGKQKFISRAVCVFMNMDKMLGGMFEKGLNSLKTVAESAKNK